MDILSKILNHELEIHNQFLSKRTLLLNYIKQIEINNLTKNELLIFINDLKDILDPIKTSILSIDHILENTSFKNNASLNNHNHLLLFLIFENFFISSELSEHSELSDKELRSESEHSESDSVS